MQLAAHNAERLAVVEETAERVVVLVNEDNDAPLVARRHKALDERVKQISRCIVFAVFDICRIETLLERR